MSKFSIYDFMKNDISLINKWQYVNNFVEIMKFCKHVKTNYNLDSNSYNCDTQQKIIIKRIKNRIRDILVFQCNIIENYRKIVSDIVLLNRPFYHSYK
jgi:hypothetical protein